MTGWVGRTPRKRGNSSSAFRLLALSACRMRIITCFGRTKRTSYARYGHSLVRCRHTPRSASHRPASRLANAEADKESLDCAGLRSALLLDFLAGELRG